MNGTTFEDHNASFPLITYASHLLLGEFLLRLWFVMRALRKLLISVPSLFHFPCIFPFVSMNAILISPFELLSFCRSSVTMYLTQLHLRERLARLRGSLLLTQIRTEDHLILTVSHFAKHVNRLLLERAFPLIRPPRFRLGISGWTPLGAPPNSK